jgi:hypothetical protein
MVPVRLTNLLGSIVGTNIFNYNPSKRSLDTPLAKETFYRWEAQLAQCAYLCRLVYSPSEIFLRGVQFLDYAPDVMNDVITQLEHSFLSRASFSSLFLSPIHPPSAKTVRGRFFPRTGCALFQHHSPTSRINPVPTLYVVFKGSSSLRDFLNDAKITKTPFADIPELAGLSGTTHGGFYKHMQSEVGRILAAVDEFSVGMTRIVITGHSLGGAMATLFSLIMAHKKHKAPAKIPSIHCVTFGAPNLFSDQARNSYNSFLLDGTLTLDRVTAESKGITGTILKTVAGPSAIDIVPLIPGVFFSHPGFNILKTEMYATSRTGRAKDIDDIRAVFLGPDAVIKRSGAGPHELPADPVFWNLFLPLHSDAPLETRLRNYGQMKRYLQPQFVRFVLQDVPMTTADIQPTLNPAEESALETMEAETMQKDAALLAASAAQQRGGGFTFATTSAAANYKKQTLSQFPNRVNYQCYKRLSAGNCHVAYMGIGFVSAVRFPILRYRDESGKLHTKFVRKLEPTLVTNFVTEGSGFNPAQRYFAVPAVTRGGRGTRRRKLRVKHTRKNT